MSPRIRWPIFSTRRLLTNLIINASLISGLFGCTSVVVPPTPPEFPPKKWEVVQLIESMRQRQADFRSLRALARIDYAGPEGKSGFQEAIVVQRPDRLRLETLSFLGAILIVTVDDKEIVGYHPRESLFVRGKRSKENLYRYTQIPLEIDEITALLLGLPPVDPAAAPRLEGNALVFSPNGWTRDTVAFGLQMAVPTEWKRFNGKGEVLLSAQFGGYVSTPAGFFPSKITVEANLQGKKLEIRYQDPELNAVIASDLFSQQKPENVKEVPLEGLGG